MKDNLYTHSIDKIKAPENLLDKSLYRMRSADCESEVIVMKNPKRKIIKLTSAIAAVLAVTIGIGTIYFTTGKDTKHPFMLTANASEITPETYIEVGELQAFSGTSHYRTHGYMDDNKKYHLIDNNEDLLFSGKEFNIDMKCSGEDIESITYTANNSYLTYAPDYEGLTDCVSLTDEEMEKYWASGSTNNFVQASSCTYAYDKQPQSRLDFEVPEDTVDASYPLRIVFTVFFEEGECVIANDKNQKSKESKIFAEKFNANADDYSLDITANFKDGTKTTKTLNFRCEYTEDGKLMFYAKEIVSQS